MGVLLLTASSISFVQIVKVYESEITFESEKEPAPDVSVDIRPGVVGLSFDLF